MDSLCRKMLTFVVLCICTAAVAVVPRAAAQQGERGEDIILRSGDPNLPDYNVSAARRRRGFDLFAFADGAGLGMGSGDFSYALDNFSPCDAPLSGFCQWGVAAARGGGAFFTFQFFEVLLYAGAPPSQWRKILEIAPSAANVRGSGWVALNNFSLFAGRVEWGPRDGSLGFLHSGAASVAEEGCLNQSGARNGFFPVGLPVLAASDCRATWGGGVWRGDRATPRRAFERRFQQLGSAFTFDYWRVPDSLKRADSFLGSRRTTYGATSDHYAEILAHYGSVIPGGVGEPDLEGYPLGLVWRFDAFNLREPGLEGIVFWRATVINRSEDVWGTGVDYDSLYIGFQPGTGGSGGGGGGRFSNYYLPEISTGVYHQSHVTAGGPCTEGGRTPTGVTTCASGPSRAGYNNGGNAIIVLKSPIGDQRNKLFTRTASGSPCAVGVDPFCDPAHPLAGDTITFNHGHMCGFGGCWANTHNVNDRRSFGMISSTEDNSLDGRDGQGLSGSSTGWRTWRAHGYPTEVAFFNKYVPGVQGPPAAVWDGTFNGLNGPDTLYYDTCWRDGCVTLDGDTMPGGQINAYGNVGGVLAAGPFSLAAGDSTSWYVAFVGQRDSINTWAAIDAAIEAYLDFFPQPAPPDPPRIVAAQVSTTDQPGAPAAPAATLLFDATVETWVDPFLEREANRLEAAPAASANGQLLVLNPWLADSLRSAARDNVEALEIYKSCDGGRTYTGDPDCVGDRTIGTYGETTGTGWQAYAVFLWDDFGPDLPNQFTDSALVAGRTYTYVLVVKTRGATFTIDTPSGLEQRQYAASMRTPLTADRLLPYVAEVYVPVSRQAGSLPAQLAFTRRPSDVTVPLDIALTDNVVPGSYRVLFGNRFIVERDSNAVTGRVDGTRVTRQHVIQASTPPYDVVLAETQLFRFGSDAVLVTRAPDSTTTTTVGDLVRVADWYDGLGFAVAAASEPVFVSHNLFGVGVTPDALLGTPSDPGFILTTDNQLSGGYNALAEIHLRGDATKARLRIGADTVPRETAAAFLVQWREELSAKGLFTVPLGKYRLTWAGDPFGLPDGIVLNLGNPRATEREFRSALASRSAETIGVTDQDAADLTRIRLAELVPVRAPFTIRNETFDRDVEIAMVRRPSDRYLLGTGVDTVGVTIQPDEWVPGDVLYFLETITEDSTAAGLIVLGVGGMPIRVQHRRVTFESAVLGCDGPRPPSCNPVKPGTRGETGYLPGGPGDQLEWEYYVGHRPDAVYEFDIIPPVTGDDITVTDSMLQQIMVVPNPFVLFSAYQTDPNDPRIIFTHVPPIGVLRIYTVSGQFVQQISWTPADLMGAGDLHVRLVTQWGFPLASGLYIWVLTAPSLPGQPASRPIRARGKFVVIQGLAR